jgi:hypothetical protein
MGRASSTKKVARASRAGGRGRASRQRSLLFPVTMAVVAVLGVLLIVVAKNEETADATPPTVTDHWHTAFGIYECDAFSDVVLSDTQGDRNGIHTHQDGIIHIHPVPTATGTDATLGKFLDEVGLDVSDDGFSVPGGNTYENGDDCGGEEGRVQVAVWDDITEDEPSRVLTEDFDDIRFTDDRSAITLAFAPDDAEIPKPPSIPQLDQLTDVPQPAPTDTTAPSDTTAATDTTATGDTTTTASTAAGETTTTAAGETTTTTAAGAGNATTTSAP